MEVKEFGQKCSFSSKLNPYKKQKIYQFINLSINNLSTEGKNICTKHKKSGDIKAK